VFDNCRGMADIATYFETTLAKEDVACSSLSATAPGDRRRREATITSSYLEVVSNSPAQTRKIGRALGRLLRPGDVVLLEGPFGAGKTVLVQGIASGLRAEGLVSSPSFTLVNEYRAGPALGNVPIYHADLYRIHSEQEALDLGLEEYLSGRGIFLAEWPERARGVWPEENLWIRLEIAGEKERKLKIQAIGQRYVEMLRKLSDRLGIKAE